MDVSTVVLREDFRKLLIPLRPEELAGLEASLLDEGCRDPLVVWPQGPKPDDRSWCECKTPQWEWVSCDLSDHPRFDCLDDDRRRNDDEWMCWHCQSCEEYEWEFDAVLVDGHNRYEICQRHGIPFETTFRMFDSELEARIWVKKNQLARRNLTDDQRAVYADEIAADEEELSKQERAKKGRAAGGDATPEQKAEREKRLGADAAPERSLLKTKKDRAVPKAAKSAGVSERKVRQARKVRKASPELVEKVRAGKLRLSQAVKEVERAERQQAQQEAVSKVSAEALAKLDTVCNIRHCSMEELFHIHGVHPDAIITDPPYPQEFVPLYGQLAELCDEVPVVAVMCGQSYLPEILSLMCKHLKYRWTLAYLTPGGQAVQQWDRKVNTFWKPVLLFGEVGEDWFGDVAKSATNDNDKRFHDWGQSESGMADLVGRLTKPGQLVCDPFMGAGTTAVACLALGRRFVGCDISINAIEVSKKRVCELLSQNGQGGET